MKNLAFFMSIRLITLAVICSCSGQAKVDPLAPERNGTPVSSVFKQIPVDKTGTIDSYYLMTKRKSAQLKLDRLNSASPLFNACCRKPFLMAFLLLLTTNLILQTDRHTLNKMDNRRRTKKETKVGIILMFAVALVIWLYSKNAEKAITNHFFVTSARITSIRFTTKVGYDMYYTCMINDKEYSNSEPLPDLKNNRDRTLLIGKSFPLIVDSTDYTRTKMLFDSSSFAEYGLRYPDSLRWLKKYLR